MCAVIVIDCLVDDRTTEYRFVVTCITFVIACVFIHSYIGIETESSCDIRCKLATSGPIQGAIALNIIRREPEAITTRTAIVGDSRFVICTVVGGGAVS